MTYHVLARKWRPQTFSDLVGQTHVVKALTFALTQNQVHHAYLFTGTRGVGKTSIARIFAKSLNCETQGVSANPCGQCESCREITAGKFVDLIEVDAASRTGVDETRELIDSVAYMPTKGRYKVYLIDEVHMFSKSSFNALLKTLEEPPEYVKFILATTDPEKLPITILSRCLQFNLKSLTQSQIAQHLANICQAESIRYDEEALTLLAAAGDGSMRDTLSMTDQAIAYGHGELSMAAVTEILGTIHPADIEAILFAVATNNPNQLNAALHRLDDYEIDARAFLIEIMKRLQRMAWAKEGIIEHLSPSLRSVVTDVPKTLLHLWYDIAEKALPNLAIAGDARSAVEMTLLRMLAFIPSDWVPRHRTVLDAEAVASQPLESESATPPVVESTAETTAEKITETTAVEATEAQKPSIANDGFATQVQAMPVTEQNDDLVAAEAQFSAETINAETVTDKVVANKGDADNIDTAEVTTNEAATISDANSDTSRVGDDDAQLLQQSWHLTQAETDDSEVPDMNEVHAVMQRGRDIASPARETAAQTNTQSDASSQPEMLSEIPEKTMSPIIFPSLGENRESDDEITAADESEQTDASEQGVVDVVTDDSTETPLANAKYTSAEYMPSEHTTETTATMATADAATTVAEASVATNAEASAEDSRNISDFDWLTAVHELALSDYTLHFVSLGVLRVQAADKHVEAVLDLPPMHEVMVTEDSLDELKQALQSYLGQAVNVRVNLTEVGTATPAEQQRQQHEQNRSQQLKQFQQLASVKHLQTALNAEIIEKTVKSMEKDKC